MPEITEVIIERFEMRRICQFLRGKNWQLTSACGHYNKEKLRFMKISKEQKLINAQNVNHVLSASQNQDGDRNYDQRKT